MRMASQGHLVIRWKQKSNITKPQTQMTKESAKDRKREMCWNALFKKAKLQTVRTM